jgi:hypothetical protein
MVSKSPYPTENDQPYGPVIDSMAGVTGQNPSPASSYAIML